MNQTNETTLLGNRLKEVAFELKILLVEDDKVLQKQFKLFLARFFSRVDTADNGLEAFEKYQQKEYDLILTDLTMPCMDGIELAEKIRSQKELQPILVLSAHSESNKLIKLINIGVDGFLVKPLDLTVAIKLLTKISQAVYDAKKLEGFNRMLEKTNSELASRNIEFEKTLNELTDIKTNMNTTTKTLSEITNNEKKSAYDFNVINAQSIENTNESLQGFDDMFYTMLINNTSYSANTTSGVITYILAGYVKELESIPEFNKIRSSLRELEDTFKQDLDLTRISSAMSMFISFFENLETWRKSIFEYKNTDNINYMDNLLAEEVSSLKEFLTS